MFSHHNIKLNLKTRKVSADLWFPTVMLAAVEGSLVRSEAEINIFMQF